RLVGGSRPRRIVEGKRAQVHGLTRLVERFVGSQEDTRAAFQLDRLVGHYRSQRRVGGYAGLMWSPRPGGNRKAYLRGAKRIGSPGKQGSRLAAADQFKLDHASPERAARL